MPAEFFLPRLQQCRIQGVETRAVNGFSLARFTSHCLLAVLWLY